MCIQPAPDVDPLTLETPFGSPRPRYAHRAVRSQPETEATPMALGHENSELEDIVDTQSVYHVVRKHPGLPARIAEETDPRR